MCDPERRIEDDIRGFFSRFYCFLISGVKICLNGRLHSGVNSVFGFRCIHSFLSAFLKMGILIYPSFFFIFTILLTLAPSAFTLLPDDSTFLRLWLASLSDL